MCSRDSGVEPQRRSEEAPLSPDNRAAPARDDRSARIRTRTSEVGAHRASGYTTDLDSRFPDASLRARMPGGQCLSARPAGRRVRSGARRRAEPGFARRELDAGQGSESGRPGSNGPLRSGAPVLFRLSYVRIHRFPGASLGGGRSPPPAREAMRPAGVEPALLPYQSSALH